MSTEPAQGPATDDLGTYGAEGATPARVGGARRRVRPRLSRRGGGILVLAAAAAATLVTLERLHPPQADNPRSVALSFLRAVAVGDAATARRDVSAPPGAVVLFTQPALSQQNPVQRPVITSVTRHGDHATVEASGNVVGFLAHSTLQLTATHSGLLGTTKWQITGGLPVLHIRAPRADQVVVDGQSLPVRNGAAVVTVLPGSLRVSRPATGVYGAYEENIAALGGDQDLDLPAQPDPVQAQQARAAVLAQLSANRPAVRSAGYDETALLALDNKGNAVTGAVRVTAHPATGSQTPVQTLLAQFTATTDGSQLSALRVVAVRLSP